MSAKAPLKLDHSANTYFSVTLSPSTSFLESPNELLARAHPSLAHVGQVGELTEVQLVSVPKDVWGDAGNQATILNEIKGISGVTHVDVQTVKQRAKRDEF